MARKSTIKLLLINKSDNESERLISIFRNAGRVARSHRPDSAEELHNMLEEGGWDLIIADDRHPEIALEQCLLRLQEEQNQIPVIVLRDEDHVAAMEAGANDVIAPNDDQRLVLAAFRELNHWDKQRELIATQAKLEDAEQRSQLLMAESEQAIAYVADGMVISCNDNFASRFGYDSADDLDCAPIIDLIQPEDHDRFKNLLKSQQSEQTAESNSLDFQGLHHNGEGFPALMELSNAVLDEENCIQLIINDPGSQSAATQTSNTEADQASLGGTGSYQQLLAQLNTQITSNTDSSLLLISIDEFIGIRNRIGITATMEMTDHIGEFFSGMLEASDFFARCTGDSYVLLSGITENEALKKAEQFRQALEHHIIEINGQSIQCTCSIGVVAPANQNNATADQSIDSAFSACQELRQQGKGNGVLHYVPTRERKTLGDTSSDQELDSFLAEALEDGHFSLNYQPVVSLRGTTGDHYEVNTLMTDDEGQRLGVEQFSQNINFSGVNTRLDRWVLLEATKQLADKIGQGQDTRLFINLTANALQDDSLLSWFGVALKAGGIPPEAVIFQFTETDVSDYLKVAKAFCEAVKELGCKISIANFGQSENPFKSLQHVQPDYAKIASRYTDTLQDGGDSQVLRAMVNSINENKAHAIISGVENASALAQLWQLGVDYIQGSYLSDPIDSMSYEFTDIA